MNEATTLRRHIEATHAVSTSGPLYYVTAELTYLNQGKYRVWTKRANFESKLPGDVAARKKKADQAQRSLDADLVERKLAKVLPYTDQLFKTAAIQWLVATDQVCY